MSFNFQFLGHRSLGRRGALRRYVFGMVLTRTRESFVDLWTSKQNLEIRDW